MTDTTRWFLAAAATVMGLLPALAHADPSAAIVRIGELVPPVLISPEDGMRQGLRELGYVEGKNLTIERRLGESSDVLQSAAMDLVRSRVDVIVAFGTQAARAALSATSTIPVVFISGDPVGTGLAASLARPGANATGVSSLSSELMSKRLELLQKIAPRIRRVILLGNPSSPLHAGVLRETQNAARTLHLRIVTLEASSPHEIDAALRAIPGEAADAFLVSSEVLFLANKAKIAEAITKAKLPAIFPWRDYQDAGALMSYGANLKQAGHQMAGYVDRILRGAKPGELPIEQMSKYELVIDLRVARAMGLKVPQDLLLRADEVLR
jgi:putative ABC transport system substrate-binding protein